MAFITFLLLAYWLAHHDIHSQLLSSSSVQVDVLSKLEAQLAIDDDIDFMRTFEVAR